MDFKFADNYLDETNVKKSAMREGAGLGLAELGAEHADVILVGADTIESCRGHHFAEKFPDRTVQVGVAEQNLIGVCAGLAYEGKVPFGMTYAPFLIGRAWEPIRTTIAYPGNHVILLASHAGIATGSDGPTHQMTEDIALTACLPGFTVLAPCDHEQAKLAVKAAYDLKGPVYIRCAREATPVFTTPETPFEIGKAQVMREGTDVTAIGHGYMTYILLQIAEELRDELSIEVINIHTIKPLDGETILASTKKTGRVFTAEDHNIVGGMGSIIAAYLGENGAVPMKIHGVYDRFTESGSAQDLWKKYGLDKEGTKKVLLEFINR